MSPAPDPVPAEATPKVQSFDEELRRRKYAQLSRLMRKWMEDESGYDARVLPILMKELEDDTIARTTNDEPSA